MNVSHTAWEPERLNAGRLAAIAFAIGVTVVIYGNFVLRGPLFVGTDMTETIRRTEGGLRLLRTSVVLDAVYALAMLLTAAALYVLLSPVRRLPALIALLCQAVHALTVLLMGLNFLKVARLVTDEHYANRLDHATRAALIRLDWQGTTSQYYVGLMFWAVATGVFSWLWLRSRQMPAWFAWFGIVTSAWCALCTACYLIEPAFRNMVNLWWFDVPMMVFLLAMCGWLLARPRAAAAVTY